jgi:hypothetical protein
MRPAALAQGVHAALDLAQVPGRAEHARSAMRAAYDISVMAATLADVYATATVRRERRAS